MTLPNLPNNKGPVYTLTLPSSLLDKGKGKKIKYRPFQVKDDAALLTAKESEDLETIVATTKQVLQECIISKIDLDSLPYFDLSYIFTQIRAKSVGEIATFKIKCQHCNQEDNYADIDIDLTKLDLVIPDEHSKVIDLGNGLFVTMKYIPFSEFSTLRLTSTKENLDKAIELIVASLENIYTEDELWNASDYSNKELGDFIRTLTKNQLQNIKDKFFNTMPRLEQELEYTCPKCKTTNKKTVGNLINFFL